MSAQTQTLNASERSINLSIAIADLNYGLVENNLKKTHFLAKTESDDQLMPSGICLIIASANTDYENIFNDQIEYCNEPVNVTVNGELWNALHEKYFFIADEDAGKAFQIFTYYHSKRGKLKCSFFDLTP